MQVPRNKKHRVFVRLTHYNRLSFPVLFNAWEQHGLDREMEIIIKNAPLDPGELADGDTVLYSFMTPHLPEIHREIKTLKTAKRKRVLLVAGGPHVTGEQEMAFNIGFDTLIIGPGERPFVQFGKDLAGDCHVDGVYRFRDGDHGDDFDCYLPVCSAVKTIPPLEIMRGCYWRCRYCSTPIFHLRHRSIDSITAYLHELKQRAMSRVNFISPSSMEFGAVNPRGLNLERIAGILDLSRSFEFPFVEYGIFPSEVRPDTVTDEGMVLLKKYVSNRYITVGAQSGCNRRLKALRRGHSIEDTQQAAAVANAHGFKVHLDFMVGFPDETPEERRTTIEFIKKMNRNYRIRIHLHHFLPLSGSPYGTCLPSFMGEHERESLKQLATAGIAAGGWEANERQALAYVQWLTVHSKEKKRQV